MATRKLQLKIGGLACSFCAESIHKAFRREKGVQDVHVSLAHEEVLIEYDHNQVDEPELRETILDLGYTLRDPDKVRAFEEQQEELAQHWRRLIIASGFTAAAFVLMVVMWLGVMSSWLAYGAMGLALATMFGPGGYILKKAYQSLRRGILNQHVLLEFGAFSGLVGGAAGLFYPAFPAVEFFGVSVFVTTYHVLSGWAANKVRARAAQAVRKLLNLQPETARRIEDGREVEVRVEKLRVGDRVRVRPGEKIPIDAQVIKGHSGVDESIVTGESIPVEKSPGDELVGGSINQVGSLVAEVTKVGADTFLQQVAGHIEEARAMKPGIIQLVDRVLKYYVPGVVAVAGLAFLVWTLGAWWVTGEMNLVRAIFAVLAVFVMGYPCALGMATPLAMIRGGGIAADHGILMRSGEAFQVMKDIDTVVLDKTGTLTIGEPTVVNLLTVDVKEGALLRLAGAVEQRSEHPLARAVVSYGKARVDTFPEPSQFRSITGKGVKARVEDQPVFVGSLEYLRERHIAVDRAVKWASQHEKEGHTVIGVAIDGNLAGLLALADTLKADAKQTVAALSAQGRRALLLTGDNERTARAIAWQVGIEDVQARVSPAEKADWIRSLQRKKRRVAMVGDGINDAPALTQADVGLAIGAGTDIAIESADVVLMGDRLYALVEAFAIGENSYRKTRQNLMLAFAFNGIGVPLAATGWVYPVWAMVAMVASVTTVLANSFGGRMLGKTREIEKEHMHVTFKVPNIHCEHCVETIQRAVNQHVKGAEVHVDVEAQRVEVLLPDSKVTAEGVREILTEIGFKPKKEEQRHVPA